MTAFIDTSVLYALLATDTDEHAASREAFITVARAEPLVTHAYVEVETISLVQRRLGMPAVERLTRDILPAIDVEMVTIDLHRRAREDLASRRVPVGLVRRSSELRLHARAGHPARAVHRSRTSRSRGSRPFLTGRRWRTPGPGFGRLDRGGLADAHTGARQATGTAPPARRVGRAPRPCAASPTRPRR